MLQYKLQNQYQELIGMVEGLPVLFLIKQHNPEKWSIHENLAHLGRYQEIFEDRFKKILEESTPAFGRYKAESDAAFENWLKLDSRQIIQKSLTHRKQLSAFILTLSDEQIQRKGIHPKLGALNIEEWTRFFLLHESHHMYTVFWLIHEFRPLQ